MTNSAPKQKPGTNTKATLKPLKALTPPAIQHSRINKECYIKLYKAKPLYKQPKLKAKLSYVPSPKAKCNTQPLRRNSQPEPPQPTYLRLPYSVLRNPSSMLKTLYLKSLDANTCHAYVRHQAPNQAHPYIGNILQTSTSRGVPLTLRTFRPDL